MHSLVVESCQMYSTWLDCDLYNYCALERHNAGDKVLGLELYDQACQMELDKRYSKDAQDLYYSPLLCPASDLSLQTLHQFRSKHCQSTHFFGWPLSPTVRKKSWKLA